VILLDTNALIWWTTAPEKLSKKARNTIEKEIKEMEILISSISVWEVFLLTKKNKIQLLIDVELWLERIENFSYIKFVSVDNRIAAHSIRLPDFHQDPADRIIVATALQYGATLITSDKKILDYRHVQTIW